jgi:hypothetical protein
MAAGILKGEIKHDQFSLNVNKIRINAGDNNNLLINMFD